MKQIFIAVMLFVGIVCAFGTDGNSPVLTGGWKKMDTEKLGEKIKSFAKDYLDEYIAQTYTADKETVVTIEHAWTQLVQGRKYLLAYRVMPKESDESGENDSLKDTSLPMLGLLIVWRNINGEITVENDYSQSALFDFIELILDAEERYAKWFYRIMMRPML